MQFLSLCVLIHQPVNRKHDFVFGYSVITKLLSKSNHYITSSSRLVKYAQFSFVLSLCISAADNGPRSEVFCMIKFLNYVQKRSINTPDSHLQKT